MSTSLSTVAYKLYIGNSLSVWFCYDNKVVRNLISGDWAYFKKLHIVAHPKLMEHQ